MSDKVGVGWSWYSGNIPRAEEKADLWEALFPTIMMGDDRAIADVRVMGERV